MAAFDRIQSGIPEMDAAFDNIRLGDNVVWRVSDLSQFRLFMEPYVEQAIRDQRNIIYLRFASHEPLVTDRPEVKTVRLPLSHRFETFTVDIHNIIEHEGKDAFYVFDCLSDLQAAWATDLMMGNFFRVTCPFLFILDTVAFFPVIRGKHSVQAVSKILDTTQLFIDIYADSRNIYVRPEKSVEPEFGHNVSSSYLRTGYRVFPSNPGRRQIQPVLSDACAGSTLRGRTVFQCILEPLNSTGTQFSAKFASKSPIILIPPK